MSTKTTDPGPARIVVGVDGSASGIDALRWAARLAPALGAAIEVVSAWQCPVEYTFSGPTIPLVDLDWEKLSSEAVDESVAAVFGDTLPDGLITTVEHGHPARTLVSIARGATMVIVGSRGLGGFTGLLLGSVSRYVAEHATCPVLVIREAPGDQG